MGNSLCFCLCVRVTQFYTKLFFVEIQYGFSLIDPVSTTVKYLN